MELAKMEVKILKALAHPIRLKIVKKLANKTLCVCELNEDIEFSQSNLSQHLKILSDAGILIKERDGTRINYYIKNADIIKVLDIIENIVFKEIKKITEEIGGK
ncbi:ArsR/SmtB family transcription factor [Paramaledivibacter caminithermalis]|jgi:ArsR family transcriptional regulator|uniref:Transcriptional regulator, ArsR family n=1 Tax=Paramaledivibacter caminithermalis (strain DSM 15212 / CIP 107654 / DViRD3) TaxID=1121301 RepID=A0A1M6LWQ5_PARC5|nr:metalloregulator ArsR/SmtB family transcription factor [Paramaledivibacter caminithermalis]SHJ75694.1 transcriptional regulator, ArsR family [Paramaledivibacter caminithermalis DSM 15212]